MLIKPITEYHGSRHTFDDDDDQLGPGVMPTIEIEWQKPENVKYVVICPNNLRVLTQPLHGETIGTIDVKYPEINVAKDSEIEAEEYDEDEQLYSAINKSSLQKKYPEESIPIILYNSNVIVLTFPNFTNIITFNLISQKIVEAIKPDHWLTLAPSNLNNNQTINKLYVDNELNNSLLVEVPNLKPPHIVTGISAAIVSQLNYNNQTNFGMIVLNSEGQPGFEKSDSDAIVDSGYILSKLFVEQEQEYLSSVSKQIRKFNPYSNSGMYL